MSQHQPEQQPQQQAAPPAAAAAQPPPAAATNGSGRSTCPPHVLEAIYGPKKTKEQKQAELDNSLQRWWTEYSDRKNDEEDEHVADSLLYDRNHLPRTAPAPECVQRQLAAQRQAAAAAAQQQQQQQQQQQPVS